MGEEEWSALCRMAPVRVFYCIVTDKNQYAMEITFFVGNPALQFQKVGGLAMVGIVQFTVAHGYAQRNCVPNVKHEQLNMDPSLELPI